MGGKLYHDEEWLRKKYIEEGLSDKEISDICDVARGTISGWRSEFNIETRSYAEHTDKGQVYRDAEWLREKYWGEELTVHEMGDEADAAAQTVVNWMDKHDIDRRTTRQNREVNRVTLKMTNGEFGKIPGGYVQAQSYITDAGETMYSVFGIHQLLAIAEGADPHKLFSDGEYVVHHENGLKWDNRPDNIMVMSSKAHTSYHHPGKPE